MIFFKSGEAEWILLAVRITVTKHSQTTVPVLQRIDDRAFFFND